MRSTQAVSLSYTRRPIWFRHARPPGLVPQGSSRVVSFKVVVAYLPWPQLLEVFSSVCLLTGGPQGPEIICLTLDPEPPGEYLPTGAFTRVGRCVSLHLLSLCGGRPFVKHAIFRRNRFLLKAKMSAPSFKNLSERSPAVT